MVKSKALVICTALALGVRSFFISTASASITYSKLFDNDNQKIFNTCVSMDPLQNETSNSCDAFVKAINDESTKKYVTLLEDLFTKIEKNPSNIKLLDDKKFLKKLRNEFSKTKMSDYEKKFGYGSKNWGTVKFFYKDYDFLFIENAFTDAVQMPSEMIYDPIAFTKGIQISKDISYDGMGRLISKKKNISGNYVVKSNSFKNGSITVNIGGKNEPTSGEYFRMMLGKGNQVKEIVAKKRVKIPKLSEGLKQKIKKAIEEGLGENQKITITNTYVEIALKYDL